MGVWTGSGAGDRMCRQNPGLFLSEGLSVSHCSGTQQSHKATHSGLGLREETDQGMKNKK